MKPYALTPYPMTPPDDPPEPVLEGALPCPECGYEPIGQIRADGQRRVRCDQNHLAGSWEDTGDKAIEYWNSEVEERKGENLKAEGVQRVAEHNEAWMDAVQAQIAVFAKSGLEFTAEDVRTSCASFDYIGQPKSPNAWGAAFSVAAKQGLIVRVGFQKNSLPSAHSRIVATWRGKQ